MRKFSVIIGAMLALLVSALPAQADHGDNVYFPGKTWLNSGDENYCLQGFAGALTNGEYDNMKSSTTGRVNSVEAVTQLVKDFHVISGFECSNVYDYNYFSNVGSPAAVCNNLASNYPGITSRISYTNLPGLTRGEAFECDLDDNGKLDFFWVAINREESGFNLHWNDGTSLTEGHWDFSGILTHEFVHALGWTGHYPASTSEHPVVPCILDKDLYNDMCSGSNKGAHNETGSDGTWWRTLESAEIAVINAAY